MAEIKIDDIQNFTVGEMVDYTRQFLRETYGLSEKEINEWMKLKPPGKYYFKVESIDQKNKTITLKGEKE